MIYLLTALNAILLGGAAYLFFTFRRAVDSSGVKQIDDYLHELEGSVAQLTDQFEKTSAKIGRDLLRKTTELQALIGECDTKLTQLGRESKASPSVKTPAGPPAPTKPVPGVPTIPPAVAARRMSASELLTKDTAARAGANQPLSGGSLSGETLTAGQDAATDSPSDRRRAAPVWRGRSFAASAGSEGGAVGELPSREAASLRKAIPTGQPNRPAGSSAAAPNEKYRLIFLLASEGMDSASIAKHTNLTRGEVEMLLDLRRQGKI